MGAVGVAMGELTGAVGVDAVGAVGLDTGATGDTTGDTGLGVGNVGYRVGLAHLLEMHTYDAEQSMLVQHGWLKLHP